MTGKEAIEVFTELNYAYKADEYEDYFYDHGDEVCRAASVATAALREQEEYEIQRHLKHFDIKEPRPEAVTKCHDLYDEDGGEILEQESGSCKNCTDHTDGCEYCRESENIYYHAGEVNALDELLYITGDDLVVDIGCRFYLAASIKFCPMCGRRLEEV